MTSGRWFPRPLPLIGILVVGVLAFSILPGCDTERYPDTLEYPVRTDWIVTTIPKQQPPGFDRPGHMPLSLLDSLPKKFDDSKKANVIDLDMVDAAVKAGTLKLDDVQKSMIEEYKSGANLLDPKNLKAEDREQFGKTLGKLFGTPAKPKVKTKTGDSDPLGIDAEVVKKLKLDDATLARGSQLYRNHCLHCHGLEGNGHGPTGAWINPHPRDFRQGVFKWTSSSQDLGERKPRRDDLLHVLKHGIEGSVMPSFGILPAADLEAMSSYVLHLSLRGEVEYFMMQTVLQTGPPEGGIEASLQEALVAFAGRWVDAQDKAIVPDPYPYPDNETALLESAARGSKLFNAGQASCVSCHKNYGRESAYYFDAWGTVVRPRDLVSGYYRGGNRPVDLYYRVWSGINGAGMASYANELRPNDDDKAKKQDKIWDLVNLMQVLHYPDLRKKLSEAPYNVRVD